MVATVMNEKNILVARVLTYAGKQTELSIYSFIRQADAQVSNLWLKKNVRVAILRKHFSDWAKSKDERQIGWRKL